MRIFWKKYETETKTDLGRSETIYFNEISKLVAVAGFIHIPTLQKTV